MTQTPRIQVPEHLEHRVQTPDGRTLAVAEWGDPDGLPVLWLHGMPGGRIRWADDPTIDARHGLRRLTFDRPGYGRSTRLAGRIVADVVPDAIAIADALGVGRFAVAGGSAGGPHALACAALLPDRVLRCLCAVSPAPIDADGLDWLVGMADVNVADFRVAMESETAYAAIAERDRQTILAFIAAGQAQIMGETEVSEADRAQLEKHQIQNAADLTDALAPGADGWVDDVMALIRPWGFEVHDIRVPVRLQYGRDDTLLPVAHGDWLAAHIPGAEVHILDAGHFGDASLDEINRAWLAGETAQR